MFGRSKHGWIGLDIGASNIKLAQMVRQGDRLHLAEAAIVPRSGAWRDDDVLDAPPISAADEISAALVTAQTSGRKAAATLPTTVCQFHTARHVETGGSEQIAAIVDELATVGVGLEDRVFDIWPGLATKSGNGGVNVLSTSNRWSETTTSDLYQAGLGIEVIDGLPQAIARAVGLVSASSSSTVAALDWGYTGATFVLVDQQQAVYVRQLRHCALVDALTAVAEQLNLTEDEASELMQTVNVSPRHNDAPDEVSQVVAELIDPVVDHLVGELRRTLEHLHNVGKNMTPKRLFLAPNVIYLFGGGATLGGVDLLLSHRLNRQVKVWQLNDDARVTATSKQAPICMLGPAIALSTLRWEARE